MKKVLIIFLFINFFAKDLFSQSKMLQEREELKYVVYYGFIELGEVTMKVISQKKENGKEIYLAKSTMKSYKGIPLVTLNSVFETEMVYDGKELYSKRFKAIEHKSEGAITTTEYIFDYDSNYVFVHKDNNGTIEKEERIRFNQNVKFQDGLSLFYFARLNSFSSENFLIPVFMNEAETSVNYYFSTTKEMVSISISDDEIKSIRCNGTANFEGIFGLTGEFVGWFSDDESRIPLKAQLNVVIGNITLELSSYKRNNWKLE